MGKCVVAVRPPKPPFRLSSVLMQPIDLEGATASEGPAEAVLRYSDDTWILSMKTLNGDPVEEQFRIRQFSQHF